LLIGLNGRKQAGKDTVYERIAHLVGGRVPVERTAFADLMYVSAAASLGVSVEELREWRLDSRVRIEITHEDVTVNGYAPVVSLTVREYIQRFGTEGHRDVFGEDFWVDQMRLEHEDRILVITDTRMQNEAAAVRAAGGTVVSIVGPEHVESGQDTHLTEAPLPDELIDVVLPNTVRDDGFRTLDESVEMLLLHIGYSR
jgi:hypothetical protein